MNKTWALIVISLIVLGTIFVFSKYEKNVVQELRITSPGTGDIWEQDKTYRIEWKGGGEIVDIYLINRVLESEGNSVSISDRIQNIRNKGFYEYRVPGGLRGEHKISIHSNGESAESDYFNIKEPPVVYNNSQYGFSVSLPEDWRGYKIVEREGWFGSSGNKIVARGPFLSIQHPESSLQNVRQDIPIMVFTIAQWDAEARGEFHSGGAAPIGPSEIGRNARYVFAHPPRYNYAFPMGWEEVDRIIRDKSLWRFF